MNFGVTIGFYNERQTFQRPINTAFGLHPHIESQAKVISVHQFSCMEMGGVLKHSVQNVVVYPTLLRKIRTSPTA